MVSFLEQYNPRSGWHWHSDNVFYVEAGMKILHRRGEGLNSKGLYKRIIG